MLFDILKAKSNVLTDDLFSDLWKKKKGGSPEPEVDIVSWSSGTSAQIKAMLDAEKAGQINTADYWSVGDKRVFQLSAIPAYSVDGVEIIAAQSAQNVEIALAHRGLYVEADETHFETLYEDPSKGPNANTPYNYFWIGEMADVYATVGSVWRITIDNVEYRCTAIAEDDMIYVGNPKYSGKTDNGSDAPFSFYNAGWGAWVGDTELPVVSHSIKIEQMVVDTVGDTVSWIVSFVNCLAAQGKMNGTNTNSGSWEGADIRTYLNDYVFPAMSADDRAIFTQFKTITADPYNGTMLETSNDYLALCAEKEIFGQATYSNMTEANALTQFDYYKTAESHTKTANGNLCYWWQRSPCKDYDSAFCLSNIGNASFNPAGEKQGISPFGCI